MVVPTLCSFCCADRQRQLALSSFRQFHPFDRLFGSSCTLSTQSINNDTAPLRTVMIMQSVPYRSPPPLQRCAISAEVGDNTRHARLLLEASYREATEGTRDLHKANDALREERSPPPEHTAGSVHLFLLLSGSLSDGCCTVPLQRSMPCYVASR